MLRHRKNSTSAEKQHAIKNALVLSSQREGQAWLSTNQLANKIGVARNGRFKAVLDWMVECGTLQRREMERPGRWPGYEYALSQQVNRFYNRPRTIKVKKHGKEVASLEMLS
jgi:hypothetical protein